MIDNGKLEDGLKSQPSFMELLLILTSGGISGVGLSLPPLVTFIIRIIGFNSSSRSHDTGLSTASHLFFEAAQVLFKIISEVDLIFLVFLILLNHQLPAVFHSILSSPAELFGDD